MRIAIDRSRLENTRIGYERKTNVTEEKRRKNETIGTFAIVEMTTGMSKRRIMIKIVIEMIEIAIGKMTRVGCERRRDANANMKPRRTEIVTNDTRDGVRWSGKRVGRA